MKYAIWLLLVLSCSAASAQTPTPDPIGGGGAVEPFDCAALADLIRLCRDFSIPAQDARVDAAWEAVLVKMQEQAVAYAAWRDCAREDYQRLMLAWQASMQALARARETYESEKALLKMLKDALEAWILQYQREGC